MATIKGTHTRNTSKGLSFHIEYLISDDDANLREVVTAKAWFYIGNWGFSQAESGSVTINIGGSSKKVSWSTLNCASHYTWYQIGSHTAYFPYGTSNTSVTATATTTDIYCGGYGPGKCTASATFNVSTGCSLAGSIGITINGEDSATWRAVGLKSTTAYRRNVNWWFKPASSSSWTKLGSTPIAANAAAGTPFYTKNDLIPGTAYNFDFTVYASTANTPDHTKLMEKVGNGTTTAAAGSLSLSNVNVSGVTATVTGMKSTSANVRSVKFWYRKTGTSSWSLSSTKTIAANTAAGSPTYTFVGLMPGTKYDILAEILHGTSVVTKQLVASCSLPYAGVSVPAVDAVQQESPSARIRINWHLKEVFTDSLENTTFTVYLKRQSGAVITAATYTGNVFGSDYSKTTDYDASSWMLQDETITAYVEAKSSLAAKSSVSNDVKANVTRMFYWDTAKEAGEEFGISAQEWNRLKQYVNAAAALYPDHFTPISFEDVGSGDEFTAALANAAAFASTITVDTYDTITASDAMAIQTSLQQRMKEATGL